MITFMKIHDKSISVQWKEKVEIHQVIELQQWTSERLIFHSNFISILLIMPH